jgi:hypothetical protein
VIEQHHVSAGGRHHPGDLVDFALPHQGRRIRFCAALHQRCRNLRASTARQFLELS